MKCRLSRPWLAIRLGLFVILAPGAFASTVITNIAAIPRLTIASEVGMDNQIQYVTDATGTNWVTLTNLVVTQTPYQFVDATAPTYPPRFYRVLVPAGPTNMVVIPAGTFAMGDSFGDGLSAELPVHTVSVSAVYMDRYEVTLGHWNDVVQWAETNGYVFDFGGQGRASDHPVQSVTWYDAVKWCNARSEREGRVAAYYVDGALTTVYRSGKLAPTVNCTNGFRLPTEAEWEKAARGSKAGRRFPWADADTITHVRANYFSRATDVYDASPTSGFHPVYAVGDEPYTSPVGAFPANSAGLYDMAGNVSEWCWDWYDGYTSESQSDPHGPGIGSDRILRGGGYGSSGWECRVARRQWLMPDYRGDLKTGIGFRCVLPR